MKAHGGGRDPRENRSLARRTPHHVRQRAVAPRSSPHPANPALSTWAAARYFLLPPTKEGHHGGHPAYRPAVSHGPGKLRYGPQRSPGHTGALTSPHAPPLRWATRLGRPLSVAPEGLVSLVRRKISHATSTSPAPTFPPGRGVPLCCWHNLVQAASFQRE